jgi:hypothetical protein
MFPIGLLSHVVGLGLQGVLHARLSLIDPFLDLRRPQIELTASFGYLRFALDDLQHQRRLPTRCPTLAVFFHHCTHLVSPWIRLHLSRLSLGQYRKAQDLQICISDTMAMRQMGSPPGGAGGVIFMEYLR